MRSHKVVVQFGEHGYTLPAKARAPRSVRKRRIYDKNLSGVDKMGAIDLLANLAGSLLFNACEDDSVAVQNSVKAEDKNPYLSPSVDVRYGVSSCNHLLVGDIVENGVKGFGGSSEDRNFGQDHKPGVDYDVKPDVVVSIGSDCSTEVGAGGNNGTHGPRDNLNLFSRDNDDDENLSGYVGPYMTRPVPRIRIRKILASRHWKGGSRNNADAKPWYCSKRSYYLHHQQRNYPIKKKEIL